MNRYQIAFLIALVIAPLWNDARGGGKAPDELQRAANVVGEYLLTLYSNDRPGNEKTRIPGPEGALLVGRAVVSDDKLALVRQEVSGLKLGQVEPFQHQGRNVKPDAKGEYPVGTSVSFTTQSRGVILVIPVVKITSGWKVDVRFWVAMRKQCKENDPEDVTRKFLYKLICRQEDELKELVVQGSNLRSILSGNAPSEDQYYALAMEMPVVEAMEGEGMLLADGTAVVARQSAPQYKWLTGLYGPLKLVFELRRAQDKWRVVPRDYLAAIATGETRPATQGQLTDVQVILPPEVAKPKIVQSATAPKPVQTAPVPKPVTTSASSNSVSKSGPSAGVGIGSSREEVRKALGAPKGQMAMGSKAIWTYPAGTVEFRDGNVESFNGVAMLSAEEAEGSSSGRKSGQIPSKFTEVVSLPETKVDELQQAANAVGQYFLTLGTGDRAGNEKISYPVFESIKLCEIIFYPRDIADETITKVREEVSGMNLTQESPFRVRGKVVKPDARGRYPVGTTIVLCTEHVGTTQAFSPLLYGNHDYTLIPVIKTETGWKVDVRFWLARLNLTARAKEINSSSPEWVIWKFFEHVLRHNIKALIDVTPSGSDYLSLTNSLIHPDESELFEPEKAGMFLTEAQVGEAMLLADGTVVVAQAGTDQVKWLAGFWGRHQKLLFELRREQNGWRVVPRDYIGVIRNGKAEFDACGKLPELKMVLPPVVPKPPDIQAAVPRPSYVVMAEGEAKAALEGMMEEVRTADDWASLARHIDWVTVFLQTKLDVLKSLGIKTPDELRNFCVSVQRQPSEFVRRPLKIWLSSPQPEDAPVLERLERAIKVVEPSMQTQLKESLTMWKTIEFTAEEQPGEGVSRVVKMTVTEGRETADLNVSMVKIGRDCLLEARWLPKILEDLADDFWENKEISAAIRELRTAAQKRKANGAGLTE
ncbi:MAG: hypothetical protein WCI95_06915 [bacterium]